MDLIGVWLKYSKNPFSTDHFKINNKNDDPKRFIANASLPKY